MNTLPRSLVIVESPSKANKILEYLRGIKDREYAVECCMGHVRNLPTTKRESPKAFRSLPIPGNMRVLYRTAPKKSRRIIIIAVLYPVHRS